MASEAGTGHVSSTQWALVAPPVGTADMVVTFSASRKATYAIISLTDAEQALPGPAASASGSSTAPSVSVASATGELVIDAVAARADTTVAMSVGAGQTQVQNAEVISGGSGVRGGCSHEAGAASVAMDWTLGESRVWTICGVGVAGAAALETSVAMAGSSALALAPQVPEGESTLGVGGVGALSFAGSAAGAPARARRKSCHAMLLG